MMNEPLAYGPLIGILAMAFATLMTRFAGYWLMGHIPLTKRVRRVLEILPGAIMAATIVPIVAKVGPAALIAVVVAAVSMIVKRNEFIAVGLALVAVSLTRAFGV
ncbi:MAG: hypothetical protein QOH67_281 [Hyphomicrobiales bacterium]|jgi:uncharacterized membrane protein|nr:hypothetical protein [Hyphomicrobiales bacterium]